MPIPGQEGRAWGRTTGNCHQDVRISVRLANERLIDDIATVLAPKQVTHSTLSQSCDTVIAYLAVTVSVGLKVYFDSAFGNG